MSSYFFPTPSVDKEKDPVAEQVKKSPAGGVLEKSAIPRAPTGARGSLAGLRVRRRGNEVESFRLPTFYSGTTVAATTYTTVIPLVPSDSTEYSAIQALYDELIVDGVEVRFMYGYEVGFTTVIPAIWGIAYDPISSAALSSTAGIVQHSQHLLFAGQTNATATVPGCSNSRGLFSWDIKTPSGSARSSSSGTIFGHEWSSTSDTGDVYGYLKPYWKSLGATGTIGFEMIVTYLVRVRCRT